MEEANTKFDKIGEDAPKELDETNARMQAFEESSEFNRWLIKKSEQNLLDFEEQHEKDRNEVMLFKNLRQKTPIHKTKAKEEAKRIT
ncbi:hypothetical protein RJ641_017749 [Dillenia turbinata]|uniref:Uncharacterized protein n=1 Tax=Dillenia turbinata TaxID=194707 RepID=A0AAN8Z173_9MAGN